MTLNIAIALSLREPDRIKDNNKLSTQEEVTQSKIDLWQVAKAKLRFNKKTAANEG